MLTRQQIRNELVQLWAKDIGELESGGKNRSPMIDEINKTIPGSYLGAPYCIAGLLHRGVNAICKKYDLQNPVKQTPSTQKFFDVMQERGFYKPHGEPGDIAIMQNRKDSGKGHAWGVEKRTGLQTYDSIEYNTDVAGDRDGDGVHRQQRDDDGDSSKRLRGFIDVVDCIADANPELFEAEPVNNDGPSAPLVLAWDGKPGAREWTSHLIQQLMKSKLPDLPINDIELFERGYTKRNRIDKVAFWARLISKMTQYESKFNPACEYEEKTIFDSKGNKVVSTGLLQMSVESLRGWGIQTDQASLKNPIINLTIAVQLMEKLVSKHRYLTLKVDGKWKGLAAYWSVMRSSSDSFIKIKTWV